MTEATRMRASRLLQDQNYGEHPSSQAVVFAKAYIVGNKIFLDQGAAIAWKNEVVPYFPVEELSYQQAWNHAHRND